MSRRGGLATHPKAFNPFSEEIEARIAAKRLHNLTRFFSSRRMRCPGGCGIIHETNLQAHQDYGCEGAAAIGRGPVASS